MTSFQDMPSRQRVKTNFIVDIYKNAKLIITASLMIYRVKMCIRCRLSSAMSTFVVYSNMDLLIKYDHRFSLFEKVVISNLVRLQTKKKEKKTSLHFPENILAHR